MPPSARRAGAPHRHGGAPHRRGSGLRLGAATFVVGTFAAGRNQHAVLVHPAQPPVPNRLELPVPQRQPQPQLGEPGRLLPFVAPAPQPVAAQLVVHQLMQRVVDHVVLDPHLRVPPPLAAHLVALLVRHDLHHQVRRLAELPHEVGPVPLVPPVLVHLHVQAHEHVRHDRRIARLREHPHVGRRQKGAPAARPRPKTVQRRREQALLLLGEHVHRRIILGHQGFDVDAERRSRRRGIPRHGDRGAVRRARRSAREHPRPRPGRTPHRGRAELRYGVGGLRIRRGATGVERWRVHATHRV